MLPFVCSDNFMAPLPFEALKSFPDEIPFPSPISEGFLFSGLFCFCRAMVGCE